MTTNPMGLERKVRQLDNDVQSIYEMLAAIQGTQLRHGNRIDEVSEKVDTIDSKVDGLEGRFDGLDGKLDTVLATLRREPPAPG